MRPYANHKTFDSPPPCLDLSPQQVWSCPGQRTLHPCKTFALNVLRDSTGESIRGAVSIYIHGDNLPREIYEPGSVKLTVDLVLIECPAARGDN
ncbi:hypothetical protein M758_4G066000 [Ceratodon purpureus]|uniref:Uncharacterized protein n=1 Tax=Ceratodon purpureus TaxID=3225 RepID=A0A8T0GY43_CERPU|nr:hypothetical protein KC19_8G124900 [Ceratodon purpureus]KAG0618467.1 hypothetical protein M758_4G066000 [Ceratodon purpureus]